MNSPRSIALFGGSFDPIHLGHVGLLEEVTKSLEIDEIHLLPCKQSPHKENAPNANDSHRLEMCRIATTHLRSVVVSDLEITRPTPSYSWMTVEHYQTQHPNTRLYWIMGTDQWEALERWSRVNFLRSALTFIVIQRQQSIQEKSGFSHLAITFDHEISATEIRHRLKAEKPVSKMLPAPVAEYIDQHGLYRD